MKNSLMFGTDGIRGNAQEFPFTPSALFSLGRALVQWSKHIFQDDRPIFIIGNDTRESCEMIKYYLLKGILHEGGEYVNAGIIPTPAILRNISDSSSNHVGLMISASHNLYEDNGIKIFNKKRGKISAKDEAHIVSLFESLYNNQSSLPLLSFSLESSAYSSLPAHHYQKSIINCFPPHFLKKRKIVLDCAHGATYALAPVIFEALGATVFCYNKAPSGTNINKECGALNPSFLQKKVLLHEADIGFAFDGDGDRLIAVNKEGIIKDGDDILSMLTQHPDFVTQPAIVGTVMTNYGFEHMITSQGKLLVRTPVGDKHIASYLEEHDLLLGGEISGHIIIRSYLNSGDGILSALKLVEALEHCNNWEFKSFSKYPQIIINIPVARKDSLQQEPYSNIIKIYKEKLKAGRLVVRFSGTEKVLRVMAEDASKKNAQQIAQELASKLSSLLAHPLIPQGAL